MIGPAGQIDFGGPPHWIGNWVGWVWTWMGTQMCDIWTWKMQVVGKKKC